MSHFFKKKKLTYFFGKYQPRTLPLPKKGGETLSPKDVYPKTRIQQQEPCLVPALKECSTDYFGTQITQKRRFILFPRNLQDRCGKCVAFWHADYADCSVSAESARSAWRIAKSPVTVTY